MIGTIINVIAIIMGTIIGRIIKRGIPKSMQETIIQGVAIVVLVLGIDMALQTENLIYVLLSVVMGTIIGEFLKLEHRLEWLGEKLELLISKTFGSQGEIAKAFVFASLLYGIGPMAIMGALEDGLTDSYDLLLIKSTLDGITSIILGASMGIGIMFSAIPVLIYQGTITLFAGWIEQYLTASIINEMTAVGGILILAISLNILKLIKVKVGNMLPAIIIIVLLLSIF